ncbi:tRNA (N(6)-L-threonylcarbamoyladenosine(37)-C(2))-methylthiotransferase MtaB [Candidatus Peregrinibacteria bacterium]|nr:tRNA (N(6)-L-threonylcarbamoyladenosine(37)-C(2))-methylthiotransferase MtaB [Candidatus Peregrinibacteria bacterium]
MTGCKNNRYELDQILRWAIENGVSVVREEDADYCIINTCTVTQTADKKSRQMIRKTKNQNPKAKNIVFGCGARAQKDDFGKIMEIDYLLTDLSAVIELLDEQIDYHRRLDSRIEPSDGQLSEQTRSRALTQVQDGCDNYCAYCIIASTRGASKNRKTDDIIEEIRNHVRNGYNEVVLTGINVGAFGCTSTRKPKETKFSELLDEILDKTTIPLIRISSLGPEYFNEDLYRVLQNPRICRHIHLSIQSGSTSVLERMKRQYNADDVEKVIQRLKKDIPGIAITTDIIVGFPEETDEEFEETMEFVKRNPLAKAHVFPYSIRKNTLAAKMEQVDDETKKKHAKKLQILADKQRKEFIEGQIGKKVKIIWENHDEGLTDNYIRVKSDDEREVMSVSEEVLSNEMLV